MLHVDAAWGGSCMFSSKYSHLMDGVDLADSVCWDAHKMMGMPLICSAFVVKNKNILRNICTHGDVAHYLFHEDSKELTSVGTLYNAVGEMMPKIVACMEEIGDSGWAKMVEDYCHLAQYLEEKIIQNDHLEMMSHRQWSNVCFRYIVENEELDLNKLNTEIRDRLFREGEYLVSRSNIGENVILRPVISNPMTTTEVIDGFLQRVIHHGNEIISSIPENQ